MTNENPEAVMPRVSIQQITFSDGTKVEISSSDVLLVVGPNNAGKSAALRAIRDKLTNAGAPSPVLTDMSFNRTGSPEELKSWLASWAAEDSVSSLGHINYMAMGISVSGQLVEHDWRRIQGLGNITRWFCHFLSADERLHICSPAQNIRHGSENPSHPIHFLYRDDKLELKLSARFRRAFGMDLIVHRAAGSQVPLHVGDRPTPILGEDRVSKSYVEMLEKLPALHTQGDGMRSFAGVLLATSTGRESIMLIDEPEAFLHPPQARLLGTSLIQDRSPERQLYIATHSADVLRGVLDAESADVRVVRLRRNGSTNSARLLNNDDIKKLWGDPLLRHSNILDGLFHEGVIVCESDSDCRFYSAILDAVLANRADYAKRPDLLFTHCAGKSRLHVVIQALRAVDVPVRVIADFDVLSAEKPLKPIVEALGLTWTDIEKDWLDVNNAINSKRPELNTEDVKKEIGQVLTNIQERTFPQKSADDIQSILKRTSAWAHAKSAGKAFVPNGGATKACDSLLSTLREGGLYVVENGELEGFERSIEGHGPKWVNEVLSKSDLAKDPKLDSARQFITGLLDSFNKP